MASAYPQTRQDITAAAPRAERVADDCPDRDERCRTLDRSLQTALDNVESLHLYARSIVRMLETCEVEASLPRPRSHRRSRRLPMDLGFVREDVDRMAGEVHAQLAMLRASLPRLVGKA
jgi:hypothetical protein